jgi:hypothetical protein
MRPLKVSGRYLPSIGTHFVFGINGWRTQSVHLRVRMYAFLALALPGVSSHAAMLCSVLGVLGSIHERFLLHLSWVERKWNYHGLALSDVLTIGDVQIKEER